MVQVEERRSAVENNAKQIEGRLHGVKIAHRKAENQIKMAKMIMMNELNKRANLLIEQLEKISEDFQQRLDDQLQGAIEICGQLDHVQKFITWATTHHCRGPVLFSRALISLQMQQLLEPSLHSESWSPVKIKFNWDASYWMKQISSLGQLTVEGGNCIYPQSLSCSTIMRPQPITCLALPPVFHRREPGYGYQSCCEPQMCCLHGLPSQPDPSNLDKSQGEATLYTSCVQPALISAPLHQTQQPQRCWDTESSSHRPPATSPIPFITPIQLTCGRGATSQPQATDSQPYSQSKSYLSYHPHQREVLPGSQALLSADCSRSGQCQGKLSMSTALQQELSHAAVDRDVMTEESWEERCRVEETCGHAAAAGESRELLDEELQQDRVEQSPAPQQQQQQQQQHCVPPAADMRKEQQRTRPLLTLRDNRDGRRSTSLEVPTTARDCVSDVQSSRLSPSSVCARRTRRSQSIPAELAAPSTSPITERPTGCTHIPETGNKYASVDPRQRRASDGVLCVVKETSSDMALPRSHRSPLLSYKTEPDHCFTYVNEEIDCEAKEKCRVSRNGYNSNRDVQKDSARPRVPVVCLERLKILVSQLPPHGRRQSDPLPASSMEKSETLPQQKFWHDARTQRLAGGSETRRTTRLLTAPLYAAERQIRNQSTTQSINSEFESRGRFSSRKASTPPSTDPEYGPQIYSALDLDSDSYLKSLSEDAAMSPADPDPQVDSDTSPPDSDPNAESSFEAELGYLAEEKSEAAGEMGLCSERDIAGGSEPSLEYDEDPESEGELGSEDGQGLDADAETESDVQPEEFPRFQVETDSNVGFDQPPDSQGSVESELDVESEAEFTTDDPQPLRSDLEEESFPIGPGQRSLLIANPGPLRGTGDIQSEQDEMESEDFCAVCLIGGDLLCCDRCPKVFHLSCHVPSLLTFPTGDWVCSLCRDAVQPEVEYDCENERTSGEHTLTHGLSASDQRKCEGLTLLILSNVLSAPFHEPVSPLARHYYQIIKRPMDLSVIRAKLQKRNARHYNSADQFVADFYLMFRNCAKFNYPDSEVAQAGRSLVAFFTSKLKEVFPDRVFPAVEADSDSDEYDEAYRTAEGGFPWPERREQCHRKRKRRHSLKSRRNHF
nr:PREDICTED: uncharacterized protein LOC109636745 isoform X2 [Paralichthys olivaceus]